MADPALHGGVWRPWRDDKLADESENNQTKCTASQVASEREISKNEENITDSQLPSCCVKYTHLKSTSFIHNLTRNSHHPFDKSKMSTEFFNLSSLLYSSSLQLKTEDCCRNKTEGQLDDSQVRNCCLRSKTNLTDLINIQAARDKHFYDVLHKALNISYEE